MSEFRGARGSNTGDDFHELWATRQAIRLLSNDEGLEAIAVEGLAVNDEAGVAADIWDGVDCTLYFGGHDAITAQRVQLQQLKYSAANPGAAWAIARLVGGKRRDGSVIARLAKAWTGLTKRFPSAPLPQSVLISNQPLDEEVRSAVQRAAKAPIVIPKTKPRKTAKPEVRLAYATGLTAGDFQAFASSLRFEVGAGSRFAQEEQLLRAIAGWTDQDAQWVATTLREFVRKRMRPEFAGELITRESVMLHLGVSEASALFPCPSEIARVDNPVTRRPIREASERLLSGVQYICLHGGAGVGKTTSLQEIEGTLPQGSVMIKYDCYGGGRYLDPSAFRHRSQDAFVQLTNQLSTELKLPLLLIRNQTSDYPRLFAKRLELAADALSAQNREALIIVAIDAADNAITAAQTRTPIESSFVHDFVRLSAIPGNVRFIITARTGRLQQLELSSSYMPVKIEPFERVETAENVARVWSAPESWIDDFHHLSGGVPRVQSYAFKIDDQHPSTALDRLRPDGKSLDQVFQQQFQSAIQRNGHAIEVRKLCAGLITLARPVPMPDLAAVLNCAEAHLADLCTDLAPGIRLQQGTVGFADEDFEHFVRNEGLCEIENVQQATATRLLSRAQEDAYAALNVAAALVAAKRGSELLDMVEQEPAPLAVTDPILRREAEILRLRLAIKVCRDAGDVARALRFVLMGAEGIKTEDAIRDLLSNNPDMAARFAPQTAGRLILSDGTLIKHHGPLLYQKLSVDADNNDAISVREGRRLLRAWQQARESARHRDDRHYRNAWPINLSDISSSVEAALKLEGPTAAVEALECWKPKWDVSMGVAMTLPTNLIAEGQIEKLEALIAEEHVWPIYSVFIAVPLALAGRSIDINLLENGLEQLFQRKLRVVSFFDGHHDRPSPHGHMLDAVMTACEILTNAGTASALVDAILDSFLTPYFRRIDRRYPHETAKLDLLFRAYALREARSGKFPKFENVFEPRPVTDQRDQKPRHNRGTDDHDRRLTDTTRAIFCIYATVASILTKQHSDTEVTKLLRSSADSLESEAWLISRQHGGSNLRAYAAKYLCTLLAVGLDPLVVKECATIVHGHWRTGYDAPNEQLFARLSLRQELHVSLLEDIAAAASDTRTRRIGAREKSEILVRYARLLKPISPDDANAIFNDAIDAASELDHEIVTQIRFLERIAIRGGQAFSNARNTARQLSDIIADAAIRLEHSDSFPWDESMSALVRLDTPLALANAARWDDENVGRLRETLAPLLKTGLATRTISPAQAMALSLFLDKDNGVATQALDQAAAAIGAGFSDLAEEAAYDILVRYNHSRGGELTRLIQQHKLDGPWTGALVSRERFVDALPSEPDPQSEDDAGLTHDCNDPLTQHAWSRDILIEAPKLERAVRELQDKAQAKRSYLSRDAIFASARQTVAPRDRVAHVQALADLDDTVTSDAVTALVEAITLWWQSPSIQTWCKTNLPGIIERLLPEFTRYIEYGHDSLSPVFDRVDLSERQTQDILLKGIERHVDKFGSDRIFILAARIGSALAPEDAAALVDWYADRLTSRIPPEHRDQAALPSILPLSTDEAAARFLFAYMGDCDLRQRWRAAHAVRRLARTNEVSTLTALVEEYWRQADPTFRGQNLAFYWLAARLWFVVAWDGVARQRPDVTNLAGPTLLKIALDDSFPHLLVRSFARDATEKLIEGHCFSIAAADIAALSCVNETPLPRVPKTQITWHGVSHGGYGSRFKFNSIDTIPYWYTPLIRSFANLDGDRFIEEAERWIVDAWHYNGNVREFDKNRRRGRFDDGNWSLISHRHGSKPTLERLDTHLEWHAMWCAAGELLKSQSLPLREEKQWNDWDELSSRVEREKLSEPPIWSADLLTPIPLQARFWISDKRPLADWVMDVSEDTHRSEIFPSDRLDYVVVDGDVEIRMGDRIESARIASALVSPATGGALLRALQAMRDSWDYKLPAEGEEDHEIDEEPYQLLGWLRHRDRNEGIDDTDPLRKSASVIGVQPGKRVTKACELMRDNTGLPRWYGSLSKTPMFIYEVWGEAENDEERYVSSIRPAGNRLLAHRAQLLNFLQSQALDLIIEVEVTRRGRENQRYDSDEETPNPESRFDRLYLMRSGGDLDIAEGRLRAREGDCSPA